MARGFRMGVGGEPKPKFPWDVKANGGFNATTVGSGGTMTSTVKSPKIINNCAVTYNVHSDRDYYSVWIDVSKDTGATWTNLVAKTNVNASSGTFSLNSFIGEKVLFRIRTQNYSGHTSQTITIYQLVINA